MTCGLLRKEKSLPQHILVWQQRLEAVTHCRDREICPRDLFHQWRTRRTVHGRRPHLGELSSGGLFRDRLVAACPQISFVLSGHKKGACHIVERYDDDGNGTAERIVHVMRYNYQGNKTLKRAGFLRVLTVFPSSGRLRVYTYAPYSDLEVCDPRFSKQEYFFIEGLV